MLTPEENRKRAEKQRVEGAKQIREHIIGRTKIQPSSLVWDYDAKVSLNSYDLSATAGGDKETFTFFVNDLADYPGGVHTAATKSRIMRVESWIKARLKLGR